MSSVEQWPDGLKTFIHYVPNDRVVSNEGDDEFVEKVRQHSLSSTDTMVYVGGKGHSTFEPDFMNKVEDFLRD